MLVKVLASEYVSMRTVCLDAIDCRWPDTSKDIDLVGHRFQVCWIDACVVTAQVVEHEAIRDRPDQQLIRHSMRPEQAWPKSELTVPAAADLSCCP